MQLVIALGNRYGETQFADLPGMPVVAQYAPQLELLRVASVAISHGGLNTALESISAGKPMVLIPLAYDQPANALRLERLGMAEVLPVTRLTVQRIRAAVTKVLNEPRYREATLRAQSKLNVLNGTVHAANLMEESLLKYLASDRSKTEAVRLRKAIRDREHTETASCLHS
jgi:MGT family glycosyltransferase